MYYSYVEIEYIATNFSPTRTDLALKLLMLIGGVVLPQTGGGGREQGDNIFKGDCDKVVGR